MKKGLLMVAVLGILCSLVLTLHTQPQQQNILADDPPVWGPNIIIR